MSAQDDGKQYHILVSGALVGIVVGGLMGGIFGIGAETTASSAMWGVCYGLLSGITVSCVFYAIRYKNKETNQPVQKP